MMRTVSLIFSVIFLSELVNCTSYIRYTETDFQCSVYYNSPACESAVRRLNENPEPSCKRYSPYNQTTFPMIVTYETIGGGGHVTGFRASYEFTECEQDPTPITAQATSEVSTVTSAHITNSEVATDADLTKSAKIITDAAETVSQGDIGGTSSDSSQVNTIVSISVTGVLLLALAVTAVIYIRKRKQHNAPRAPPTREERPNPIYQSQSPAYSFANNPSQPVNYEEVGVVTPNNQPDPAERGHVTTNSQSEGAVYSAAHETAVEAVHYHKETVENILYGTRE